MSKDELRDQLFAKYFEIEDGILATDLVEKLAFIPKHIIIYITFWKKMFATLIVIVIFEV